MKYSIIIPVFNEVASLRQLHDELSAAINEVIKCGENEIDGTSTNQYEIIFVDDGSTDGSTQLLRKMVIDNSHCRLIRFNRNNGKAIAYKAGFDTASGQYVLTLDADLQDVPSEIPKILTKLVEDEFDLIVGWKFNRFRNEPAKALPSKLFNRLKAIVFGLSLHDSNSGFRIMRRDVSINLNIHGGQYRFIPEIAHLSGFKVGEVPVHHRPRIYGHSKYGPRRFWTGLLDMLSVRFIASFARQPLHFFGTLSLFPIAISLFLEGYVLIQKIMGSGFQTHIAAIVIGVMFFLLGMQIMGIGLICEIIYSQIRPYPAHISERLGFPKAEEKNQTIETDNNP